MDEIENNDKIEGDGEYGIEGVAIRKKMKKILKRIKQENELEKLSIEGKVIGQEAIEQKKLWKKLRKKIKMRLEKLQFWMEERQGMVDKSKEQEQSVERKEVGGKLTEQEESMEWFDKVFDNIGIEDAKFERHRD